MSGLTREADVINVGRIMRFKDISPGQLIYLTKEKTRAIKMDAQTAGLPQGRKVQVNPDDQVTWDPPWKREVKEKNMARRLTVEELQRMIEQELGAPRDLEKMKIMSKGWEQADIAGQIDWVKSLKIKEMFPDLDEKRKKKSFDARPHSKSKRQVTTGKNGKVTTRRDDDKSTYVNEAPIQTVELTAPSHWAPLLINGDDSGMEPQEVKNARAWISSLKMGDPVDAADDSEFMSQYDAKRFNGNLAADCCTYTFHKRQ